jgi:hypothetical protein
MKKRRKIPWTPVSTRGYRLRRGEGGPARALEVA